jgi:hypothetical protein
LTSRRAYSSDPNTDETDDQLVAVERVNREQAQTADRNVEQYEREGADLEPRGCREEHRKAERERKGERRLRAAQGHPRLLAAAPIRAFEVRGRAERHHGHLLGADSGEPPGDADVPQLVDDQGNDTADAPKERTSGEHGRARVSAEGHEQQREHPQRDDPTAGGNDRNGPTNEHETSVSRYLKRGGSKHPNCIDRTAQRLDVSPRSG